MSLSLTIIVLISVIVGLILLIICCFYIYRRRTQSEFRIKKIRKKLSQQSSTTKHQVTQQLGQEDSKVLDMSLLPLQKKESDCIDFWKKRNSLYKRVLSLNFFRSNGNHFFQKTHPLIELEEVGRDANYELIIDLLGKVNRPKKKIRKSKLKPSRSIIKTKQSKYSTFREQNETFPAAFSREISIESEFDDLESEIAIEMDPIKVGCQSNRSFIEAFTETRTNTNVVASGSYYTISRMQHSQKISSTFGAKELESGLSFLENKDEEDEITGIENLPGYLESPK